MSDELAGSDREGGGVRDVDGHRVGHWVDLGEVGPVTAPKLTAVSMITDSERPDWLEVVAVFEVTPAQRAAFASLLHVEDGVRVTVEAADAPNPAPPRSAEETAREMVRVVENRSGGWSVAVRNSFLASHAWKATAAEDSGIIEAEFVRLITEARADGAAAALAGQQPRDLAGRVRELIQEYAGRWADAPSYDALCSHREAMQHLRQAYWVAKKGFDVEHRIRERIERMREDAYGSDDPVRKAADELEAVIREREEEKR